jgi:F0F1-type ATP synthase beta subunit
MCDCEDIDPVFLQGVNERIRETTE